MTIGPSTRRYLLILFFLFLSFPFVFSKVPGVGLDPSWNIALHLAHQYDLVFGKDFVFTYGPLGFLCTRLPIAIPGIVYILFDIFFLFNFIYILNETFKKEKIIPVSIFLVFTLVIVVYESTELWYFFFYLFYLFTFLKEPEKTISIGLAALLSIICFYIKLSLGIIALVIFVGAMIYLFLRGRITLKKTGLVLLAFSFVLFLSTLFLNVDFTGYVLNSLPIINAYNDSMYLVGGKESIPFLIAGAATVLCLALLALFRLVKSFIRKELIKNLDEFFIYFVVGLFSFVLFKNGFVRGDGHNYYFFRGILFCVALLFLFIPKTADRMLVAAACWITLAISLISVNSLPGNFGPVRRIATLSIFPIKLYEIEKYFSDAFSYSIDDPPIQSDVIKKIVGDRSADIVPVEISKAYFENLRYNPRPVIQSYSAYNGFLDSLNNLKYNDNSRPDFILFSYGSIDDRYAFFDEGRTKLAMLENYRIHSTIDDQLLLEKAGQRKKLSAQKTESHKITLGEELAVPAYQGLQFTKINVRYTLWGKLKRLFFRPPALAITFTLANGDQYTYRAVTSIISGGVILNKYVDTLEEFELFLRANGALNTDIGKIRLDAVDGDSGFQNEITLSSTYYKPDESSLNGLHPEDSLAIENLYTKYQALPFRHEELSNDTIQLWVEAVSRHSDFVKIAGWSFLKNQKNDSTSASIILETEGREYKIFTQKKDRPDLSGYFQRNDLDHSGFSATVSKRSLPPGIYRIGISIERNGTQTTTYSDRDVVIQDVPKIDLIENFTFGKNPDDQSFFIETVQSDETQGRVVGWATVKNQISRNVKTNLLLISDRQTYRISTWQVKRPDVADHFKDQAFLYSGFSVYFPGFQIQKGEYKIAIEQVLDDGSRKISLSDRTIKVRIANSFVPVKTDLPPAGKLSVSFEQGKDERNFYVASGWAAPDQSGLDGCSIKIILKSGDNVYVSDTEVRTRPDVTAHFNNKYNLDNSGFFARIDKSGLPPGKYQLGILILKENEKGSVMMLDHFTSVDK